MHVDTRDGGYEHDTMWIAERDDGHVDAAAIHFDLLEVGEARAAHVHRDLRHTPAFVVLESAGHATAGGVDREPILCRVPVLAEELREDAEAISALLGLAAVGIEDAQSEVGALRRRNDEDAVGSDAAMAVADELRTLGRQRERKIVRVDDDVVVSKTVRADEARHYVASRSPHPAEGVIASRRAARARRRHRARRNAR